MVDEKSASESAESESVVKSILAKYGRYGQTHIVAHYENTLTCPIERAELISDLMKIDVDSVMYYLDVAKSEYHKTMTFNYCPPTLLHWKTPTTFCVDDDIILGEDDGHCKMPPGASLTRSEDLSRSIRADWTNAGLVAPIAIVILAGGTGSRLGFDGPKGCYTILPSNTISLFQVLCERICYLQHVRKMLKNITKPLPVYIMTSTINDEETRSFWASHTYFGLSSENVFFFTQGTYPSFTREEDQILLKSKTRLTANPNGNGGFFHALQQSGALHDMMDRKVKGAHVFGVDNVLCQIGDPLFIGFCLVNNIEIGIKCVLKLTPDDNLGVFCSRRGSTDVVDDAKWTSLVVEYSELPNILRYQTVEEEEEGNGNGTTTTTLKYSAGNIANHFFSIEFLKRFNPISLRPHIAKKQVPFYHCDTNRIIGKPTTPNAIKLELFIFDAFFHASNGQVAAFQVDRKTEFAPLKNNGTGDDSVESARQALYQQNNRTSTGQSCPTTKILLDLGIDQLDQAMLFNY